MLGNRFGSESTRFDDDSVVIGLFLNASDARRALHALHENHYSSDQITAAFRDTSRFTGGGGSDCCADAGEWQVVWPA